MTLLIPIIFSFISGTINGQTCDPNDITHIDWPTLHSSGDLPPFEYEISFDQFNLEVIIDVNLTYLGYSIDDDGYEIGTTYILDFESKFAHILPLNEPGTCSNRNGSDFPTGDFESWWQYSSSDPPIVGDEQYLAYPPAGRDWFVETLDCQTVHYKGHFSFPELYQQCTNFDGTESYSMITTDDKWINLTATFYINIVSPLVGTYESGYYRVYQILSQPFILAIRKTIHVLQPIGINLYSISIIAVYKENEQNDFRLVIVTETAEYLKLSNPQLITTPWTLSTEYQIHFNIDDGEVADDDIDGNPCLNNKAYFCSQIWEIYADDVPCPPSDFSGVYGMQFNATCNDDGSDNDAVNANRTKTCQTWLDSYDRIIDLSANLDWRDEICDALIWNIQFEGTMRFYDSYDYVDEIADDHLYQVGEDRIFVEIEILIPTAELEVFKSTLVNVWICTTDPNIGEPVIDSSTGDGGCLSEGVDDDGPYYILENYDENLLYNCTHDDEDDVDKPNNIVRFSFNAPNTLIRDTLYIHAQVTLTLVDATRRRLIDGGDDDDDDEETADQIKHFVGALNNRIDISNNNPYQHIEAIDEFKKKSGFYDEIGHEYNNNDISEENNKNYYGKDNNDNPEYYEVSVTASGYTALKVITTFVAVLVLINLFCAIAKCTNKNNNRYSQISQLSDLEEASV